MLNHWLELQYNLSTDQTDQEPLRTFDFPCAILARTVQLDPDFHRLYPPYWVHFFAGTCYAPSCSFCFFLESLDPSCLSIVPYLIVYTFQFSDFVDYSVLV